MKPHLIPLILIILVIIIMGAYAILMPSKEDNSMPPDVDEGELVLTYNFIEAAIAVPEQSVTAADVAAYREAAATLSAEEQAAFYDNVLLAYQDLDYGEAFDNVVSTNPGDLDMLISLIMSDLRQLAFDASSGKTIVIPVINENPQSDLVSQIEATFPAVYLMEVFARDQLLNTLGRGVVNDDREAYIAAGAAAGLYFASEVEVARQFVIDYFAAAAQNNNFDYELQQAKKPVTAGASAGTEFDNLPADAVAD